GKTNAAGANQEEKSTAATNSKTDQGDVSKDASDKGDAQFGQKRALMGHRGLVGREIRNQAGETIGEVENVLVDPDGNKVQAVVSVGGFWGIGDEEIVVPLEKLQLNQKRSYVFFNGTEEELKAFPEYREPTLRSARYAYPYRERAYRGPTGMYTYDPYYDGDRRGMRMQPRDRWNRYDETGPQYGMRGYYHDGRMGSHAYPNDGRRAYGERNANRWNENDDNRSDAYNDRRSSAEKDRWYGNRRNDFNYNQNQGRLRASDLIGKSVRNAKDEEIGEVDDIVIASNGRMDLLISVGEFLGMGGKQVRADLNEVELDNPDYVFYDITNRELENQPAYQTDGQ
ncbi:MAG: PRC-barrel domain-containing protein, partial [Desulfosarcina sp.]